MTNDRRSTAAALDRIHEELRSIVLESRASLQRIGEDLAIVERKMLIRMTGVRQELGDVIQGLREDRESQ